MTSVRIDKPSDPRFKLLGLLLGTDHFGAKGRMVDIWSYCTEKHAYILKESMINAIAENAQFAEFMVEADLGEKVEGGIRVKGTAGRIEWLAKKRENGKKGGRPAEENLEETETEPNGNLEITESEPNANPLTLALSPTLTNSISLIKANDLPANEKIRGEQTSGSVVWKAYSEAFADKYHEPPPRNAKSNALCSQLVKRLGSSDAPEVARFYLGHRDYFYQKACHPLTLLVRDAEKIRTEWATGKLITHSGAKEDDLRQTNIQAMKEYLIKEKEVS